ncbi:MAG: O-antigen ligase family protein [Candidatus Omnitrophota bacterium]
MPGNKRAQTLLGVVLSLLFLTVIMFLSASKTPLQILPLVILLAPIVFAITFINTDVALILLIFSMMLSPELKLADVPQRAVVMRVDDILLLVVFFSWLAKMAINKQLALIKNTPLNLPIAAYILIYMFSTGRGIIAGYISPVASSFYILKYIEYFMLFFMVSNNVSSKRQIKIFIKIFLITCAITCVYALITIMPMGRATAPFEGPTGEPNTLGGYLILLFAITAGIFAYSQSRIWRFWCGVLACFIFVTLLQTLSRGSYIAFIPMYLAIIAFTRRKKALFVVILILAIFILPAKLPTKVIERITKTFTAGQVYEPFAGTRITLEQSAAYRVEAWKYVIKKWSKNPFLGFGVTGVGLVDTQYPRVLGESGIIGLLIFIWMLSAIFKNTIQVMKTIQDDWMQGLSMGFLAGLIGLTFHCFAANTFIIVRIMEPFWFLAAIVAMLPHLQEDLGNSIEHAL